MTVILVVCCIHFRFQYFVITAPQNTSFEQKFCSQRTLKIVYTAHVVFSTVIFKIIHHFRIWSCQIKEPNTRVNCSSETPRHSEFAICLLKSWGSVKRSCTFSGEWQCPLRLFTITKNFTAVFARVNMQYTNALSNFPLCKLFLFSLFRGFSPCSKMFHNTTAVSLRRRNISTRVSSTFVSLTFHWMEDNAKRKCFYFKQYSLTWYSDTLNSSESH